MAITVTKSNMPTTSTFYTASGTGTESVELDGITKFVIHSKKNLIKVNRSKSKANQIASPSDEFDNQVVDLKNGTDEIVLTGFLDDSATTSSWEKFWILRAMCATGGPLDSLVLDNLTFSSSTQQVFLEDLAGTINADDTQSISSNKGDGTARSEVVLSFFLGDQR